MKRWLDVAAVSVLIALGAILMLVASGVAVSNVLWFVVYEAIFIFLPGWLAYLALSSSPNGPLKQIAIGWALGYVLEILAYVAVTALDARAWFLAYPLVSIGILAPFAWRRHSHRGRMAVLVHADRPYWALGLVVISLVALVYLSMGFFAETPLPDQIEDSVTYSQDLVWHLANAAEAKHHWPTTDPNVAGEPLFYYKFIYFHMAAISQVTGIDLAVIWARLYIVPLVILYVVQMSALGKMASSHRAVMLLTPVVALLIGGLDPFPDLGFPFSYRFFTSLYRSPTYILGLVFYISLIIEIFERIRPGVDSSFKWKMGKSQVGDWLLIMLLTIGCAGAKGAMLPVIAAALGSFLIWDYWKQRRLNRPVLIGLGIISATFLIFVPFAYRFAGGISEVEPLASLRRMQVLKSFLPWNPMNPNPVSTGMLIAPLREYLPDFLTWGLFRLAESTPFKLAFLAIATLIGAIGLLGIRLLGLAWLVHKVGVRFSPAQAWLVALFLVSLPPFFILDMQNNQYWFLWYGMVGVCALAAHGLYWFWTERTTVRPGVRRAFTGAVLIMALLGLLDLPLDNYKRVMAWSHGEPTYRQANQNLTVGLLEALRWIRRTTDANAILAVNNYYVNNLESTGKADARYFYYAAFAERRVFLEGWMYTTKTRLLGGSDQVWGFDTPYKEAYPLDFTQVTDTMVHPYPERYALNQRVFLAADAEAVQALACDYQVGYLIVNKMHGPVGPALAEVAQLVFRNHDTDVYSIACKKT